MRKNIHIGKDADARESGIHVFRLRKNHRLILTQKGAFLGAPYLDAWDEEGLVK